jgi:hypothetical protein
MATPVYDRVDAELRRRKAKHLSPSSWRALGEVAGFTSQQMTNWKTRDVPAKHFAAIKDALGWSFDQLAGANAQREHGVQTATSDQGVAQSMSLVEITVPSTIRWEDVEAMQKLPARFTVLMPDDSLAGHIEKGTGLIFETALAPSPGKTVLIEDADGHRFVRIYAIVRGEHWQAVAKSSGYVSLDSKQHGLKVLATMRWREG